MIVRWRVWYDDGSSVSSEDVAPEDAPLDGVVAIGEEDDEGKKQIYWGQDYYQWTGDGWRCGRLADLERWLRGDYPTLKYGRWTPHTFWQSIREAIRREWL